MSPDAMKAKKELSYTTEEEVFKAEDFLSTGVDVLNQACKPEGQTFCGLRKGGIYRYIGKSQTSKSFLAMTTLTEAAINPAFDDYLLIHDNIEDGVLLSKQRFFSSALTERLRAPAYSKLKEPIYSRTMDDFYTRVNKKLDAGKPFIWIPDSMDSLVSDNESKMSDGKAKIHSNELRKLLAGLKATGSMIIMIQHAKVNIGKTFSSLVTTGGASPEFYSTLDIWLSKLEVIKKKLKLKGDKTEDFPIGIRVQAHIIKNRISGRDRKVSFPLYYDYGIDNTGASVNYLIDMAHWDKEKGIVTADDFEFQGTVSALIKHIEEEGLQRELQVLVGRTWNGIEQRLSLGRKPRYS